VSVIGLTILLGLLALAAAVATGMYWTSSLEPVSDGEKVLEILGQPEGSDAH
jgi:hypothetical protein